jgi:uncharacterized protein YndB with AHSA1/START domain
MSEVDSALTPLRKTVVVPLDQATAFRIFTARFADWWPLTTHSVGRVDALGVVFPVEVGGAIVETLRDGTTSTWGTLTGWDPPRSVSFTWHAGQPEALAGDIEVRFAGDDDGATTVELIHSGWERRTDGAQARRAYDAGWEPVLEAYRASALS